MKPESADAAGLGRLQRIDFSLGGALPLVLGLAVLAIPTIAALANQSWSEESGAHGPIVLTTGAWLLWRQLPSFRPAAHPGHPAWTSAILVPALMSYVFGRAFDFLTLEALGLYGVGLAMLQAKIG